METTSVETPGAAADMPCICVANMRGRTGGNAKRERKGREGGAPCFCSFNSGGLCTGVCLSRRVLPVSTNATLQHKVLDDIAVTG